MPVALSMQRLLLGASVRPAMHCSSDWELSDRRSVVTIVLLHVAGKLTLGPGLQAAKQQGHARIGRVLPLEHRRDDPGHAQHHDDHQVR